MHSLVKKWGAILNLVEGKVSTKIIGIHPYRRFVYSPIYLFIQSLTYSNIYSAAAAKSLQSCPTLCDPTDSTPPGSATPGILQARTLEWVAISFSNAGK